MFDHYPHPPAPPPKLRDGELGSGNIAESDESPLPLHGMLAIEMARGGLGVGVEEDDNV